MNLVRMVNERFYMIRGEEEIYCIDWVEMFLYFCLFFIFGFFF